jgi:hypothetical protein
LASNHVESVKHALFHCTTKPELVEWRGQFVEKVAPKEPRLRTITPNNGTLLLRALIFRRAGVYGVLIYHRSPD